MTNTYAINTTRGKEFAVEADLVALGVTPWVARRLDSKYIKEKRQTVWYDVPYVPKLLFCVFPAVYWNDVRAIKHVIGKPIALSERDIRGTPGYDIKGRDGKTRKIAPLNGLNDFQASVAAEYADKQRNRQNSEYECQYTPGQALEMLAGPFEGMPVAFDRAIKRAHNHYSKLRVSVEVFGRATMVEVDPDMVRAG